MGALQKTAIVIPCYNESSRLNKQAFIEYAGSDRDIHFIFVNDGSTDNTQDILEELCQSYPQQMTAIRMKSNCGKAEAVRQGFLRAMRYQFENIGYWDADLSTPLNAIGNFVQILGSSKINIVMGSRVRLLGHKIERVALRHYLGRLFATCASLILRLPVYDTQCGAKIFKNNNALHSVFSIPFNTKWIFDVEILARYIQIQSKENKDSFEKCAKEIPLEQWIQVDGSKFKIKDSFVVPYELLKIYLFLHKP